MIVGRSKNQNFNFIRENLKETQRVEGEGFIKGWEEGSNQIRSPIYPYLCHGMIYVAESDF